MTSSEKLERIGQNCRRNEKELKRIVEEIRKN
jgi:hypothetical protein